MLDQLVGSSPVVSAVRDELARLFARLAASPKRLPPVLIQGETGTGKQHGFRRAFGVMQQVRQTLREGRLRVAFEKNSDLRLVQARIAGI